MRFSRASGSDSEESIRGPKTGLSLTLPSYNLHKRSTDEYDKIAQVD